MRVYPIASVVDSKTGKVAGMYCQINGDHKMGVKPNNWALLV